MNSFQSDPRDERRPELPRKDTRALRHQRQLADGERPPPGDEELMQILADAEDPEQAELLRQELEQSDSVEEEKGEEEAIEDQDVERLLAQLTEDYSKSYKDVKDHLQLRVGPLSKIAKKTII